MTTAAVTHDAVAALRTFLLALPGAPEITEVVPLTCDAHDEPATWTYVDADPARGLARRRCLGCAGASWLLDSAERWSYPPAWSCPGCRQMVAEVAAGLHVPDGERVEWVALAACCVECGRVSGLTDVVVDRLPRGQVVGRL